MSMQSLLNYKTASIGRDKKLFLVPFLTPLKIADSRRLRNSPAVGGLRHTRRLAKSQVPSNQQFLRLNSHEIIFISSNILNIVPMIFT